jgi:hypothetical protein
MPIEHNAYCPLKARLWIFTMEKKTFQASHKTVGKLSRPRLVFLKVNKSFFSHVWFEIPDFSYQNTESFTHIFKGEKLYGKKSYE